MKVKFLIQIDEDKTEWRDLYINEECFLGFYAPDKEDSSDDSVNVITTDGVYTFLQETKLLKYLRNKFVDVS